MESYVPLMSLNDIIDQAAQNTKERCENFVELLNDVTVNILTPSSRRRKILWIDPNGCKQNKSQILSDAS
jgi:hypothetical protein